MRVIILVGGHGTRLKPLTDTMPKAMIPIEGKPVIGYVLDWVGRVGTDQIDIPVSDPCDQIREYVDAKYGDLPIRWVKEGEPQGTAHAVMQCVTEEDSGSVLVINGDMVLVGHNSYEFQRGMYRNGRTPIFSVDMSDTPGQYGVAEVDLDMWIKQIVEKPDKPESDYYLSGYYYFPYIRNLRNDIVHVLNLNHSDFSSVAKLTLKDGMVKAFPVKTLDCGSHEGLAEARRYMEGI